MLIKNEEEVREREYFNGLAKEKGVHWWGNLTQAGQIRQLVRAELAVRCAQINEGDTILEIGCSEGDFTKRLLEVTNEVKITAIDISPELIELAKKKISSDNVRFEVGNISLLDYKDESFNAVVGNAVLHHLNLDKGLHEIVRVLKEGGRIFFAEPNMLNPQIFLEKNVGFIGRRLQNSPDETAFFRWQIKKTLKKYGFVEIVVKPFDFLHPATPKALIPIVMKAGLFLERMPLVREIAGSLIISGRKVDKGLC
ncbi:MAG: class I SAM-dependent methyltransferase [bacterium]